MNNHKRHFVAVFAAIALPAAICFGLFQVKQAMASCSIAWDIYQQTCLVADTNDNFSDTLGTTFTSYNQIPWTLYMAYTPGSSSNISNGAPSPAVSETINTSLAGCSSGDGSGCGDVVSRTISGHVTASQGTFVFSAWDGTYFNCSDTFQATIKSHTGSCN